MLSTPLQCTVGRLYAHEGSSGRSDPKASMYGAALASVESQSVYTIRCENHVPNYNTDKSNMNSEKGLLQLL